MGSGGSKSGIVRSKRMPSMPQLDGSEKQVKWANDIRSGVLQRLDDMAKSKELTLKRIERQTTDKNFLREYRIRQEEAGKIREEGYKQYSQIGSAKMWIDNRNWLPSNYQLEEELKRRVKARMR